MGVTNRNMVQMVESGLKCERTFQKIFFVPPDIPIRRAGLVFHATDVSTALKYELGAGNCKADCSLLQQKRSSSQISAHNIY